MTCVITGAGRGIGLEIARLFAGRSASVALCARSAEVESAGNELARRFGVDVLAHRVDVADIDAVADFAHRAASRLGPARVVVNNAGGLGPVGRVDQLDLREWHRTLQVNVGGVVNVCSAFIPQLLDAGGGSIVNLAGGGIGGPSTPGFMSAYTTSKAAVVVLTETLARELGDAGIRVNAVAPGPMATELMRPVFDAGPGVVGSALHETSRRIYDDGVVSLSPELERLLLFLVSDESDWLTGRLLSARWDSVERLRSSRDSLASSSLLTLRRIDGTLFVEPGADAP